MRMSRSVLSLGLLALLAFTLIGHICALPHADDHAAASQGNEGHGHDSTDSLHEASCEGVRPARTSSPCVPLRAVPIKLEVAVAPITHAAVSRRPQPSSSPPLFLLHASLLI